MYLFAIDENYKFSPNLPADGFQIALEDLSHILHRILQNILWKYMTKLLSFTFSDCTAKVIREGVTLISGGGANFLIVFHPHTVFCAGTFIGRKPFM